MIGNGDIRDFVATLAWLEIGIAVVAALLVTFVTAPYGRHVRQGWGPSVPSRLAWVVMESPSVFLFALPALSGASMSGTAGPTAWLLSGLWLVHYVRRTFVWPFRMRLGGRTMPLSVMAMAIAFNLVNASANGIAVGWMPSPDPGAPHLWLGVSIFLVGFAINIWSDGVLRRLRAPGEDGYKIPRGGLYDWVSCPNYLGEIVEWCGWAIATWSLAGLAFALLTIANLAPRARAHHHWYRAQFPDYPPERRALLPTLW